MDETLSPKKKPKQRQTFLGKTAVIVGFVALFAAPAATFGAATIGQDNKNKIVVSCPAEIKDAIDLRKANPGVVVHYYGDLEAQCHINDVVSQLP